MGGEKHVVSPRGGNDPQNKRFGCVFCTYRFRHYRQLEEHMNTHTKERPHHCDKCDLFFSAGKSLWEHNRVYHLGKKWKCLICGKEFTSTSNLSFHKKIHGDADWWIQKTKELDKNDEDKKKGISSAFQTAVWKAISNNREEEKTDMEGEEEETKEDDLEVETAEEPPKKKLKLLLKKEVRSVGKVKRKWQCDLCGKTFKRFDDYSLKRHKRNVHKEILNPASVSTVVTSEIISLNDDPVEEELNEGEIHLEISSVPEVGNSLEEPPPPPGQEEPEVENNLVKTKTPVPEVKISKKGKREWECQICQKKFYRSDNYSLKRHLSTVHRELNISISGIQWSKEITSGEPSPLKASPVVKKTKLLISRNKLRNLRRKRKKKVDKQIGDPCPFCGKLFTRIDSVYRHIERFHSEEQGNRNEEDFQKQVDEQEEEDDDDDDDADEVEEEEPADKTGSSPLQLFTDAPIQLNLHPPCSIPFFNSAAVAADTPPQSKKEWDPSFFLHMNRYDPNKDAESLNPPPPPPPPTPPQNLSPLPPPPSSSISKNLYKCDKCGHTMAHKWSLQRHQKRDSCTAPKKMFQSPLVPTLRYVCAFCNYDFNDRRFHLVRHLSGVHRFGDGDTNHQQAANQSSHSHSRKIRSDFSCVYCDERTVTKEKMQAHIARNHIHLLGIPREDWQSSNSIEQQDGRQNQSRPPPPSSSTQAEEQPVPVPVVTSEIIDLSDNSLSSSVGSSLIEITEDPPPPHSSPYPSDQSDESIVFIEELEKGQNPDPPPPPNSMENESQALTQLVDSTSQKHQEIEPVLPSSSSLASQETQEIPPLSLAEAMQLDRDLGGEHTPQSMGTSTTTSASQSTAPSSPASVVSESELDTTLDEDVVSPAIPVEEEQDFHSFKVARNYDAVKPKPTTSSSVVPVDGNGNETSVQFSTSSSSSSSEETHEDNELSLSTTSPPQQVAFEKEVETIIEALLPLVSRFDFDNEIVSSVQVEMVELDTEINTEKVQQQPSVIDDHGGTGILESPVISKHIHSPTPVIPKITEEDLSHHSPEYKVPSPVGSEHLKSPPGGISSEPLSPFTADQDHPPAEVLEVPVEPITSISQVELPIIAKHVISPSSSPVTSEHAEPTSMVTVLVEQLSPQPVILREHLHESPSIVNEFMKPPTPTHTNKESFTNLADVETCLVTHSPPRPHSEELPPPSQLEYPVIEEHVKSPQTSSQSPPNNSENVESPQSITVLEESTPNSPNSPSSSIEMIDEHVHQSPSQTSSQQMELDTTTLERVDVNTLPSIPEHMEPPEHAHVTPQTVELPPTQHVTPPVIPLNNEPTPSLVTFPIGSPVIISQPSTPTSPSSPIEMIDELVESPSQTSPQQMELDTATVNRVDVDTPSSIPEHRESPYTKASPEHVSATPQTMELPPMQHATSLIITSNDEATPSSVTFPIGSPVIISQPSTPNSPSSPIEILDEHVQSPQTSPLSPHVISEDMEREDDVDFEPPSVPEHVGQPVTPPPEFHVHAIPETVESSSTLPVITLNEEPMPSTTINSGCVDSITNSQSPSSPQSIIELEESNPNSPASSIKMIDDLGQSPQTSPHVISKDMERDDPIFERVDTPSVPEQMEPPQTSPLPPSASPKNFPESPPEDEQVIPETVESPPPTQHITLPVITSNQDSVPAAISECIDSAPAPMSPSLSLLHSDTELEEGTSNSASLYVQLIEECSKSPQTSQPSPHINLEPMKSDAVSLESEDSPPPPSIHDTVESPMTSSQVLPESPPDDVHVIPETEESPPTQLVTLPAITSNQDSSPPPSISECIDSDPAPVSPPSLPLPHSDTELVELAEPTSNSPSKFIEVIDEDIESTQESPQSSPHTNHQQVESGFDILERMDSPASIPEYVESPPQTPPPLYASVLPPESPPDDAHVIPETVGSPPPIIQHDTLPVTTLNVQSTPSTECDESASISELSPNSGIEPEKSSSNSPSQSIQIIDECVESPQTSQPSSPQNIPEQEESGSSIILEHVASPHVIPERVESPHTIPQEMVADHVVLVDRVDTPSSPNHLESPQTSPQIPPESPPPENVNAIPDTEESPAIQLESFSNSPSSPFTEKIDQCSQSPQTSQPSTPINPEPMESDPASLDREDSLPPPSIPDTLESIPIPHAPPLPTPHVELEKTPQSPIINSESVEPLPMSQSSPQSTTDMDGTSLKSPSSSIEMDDELVQSPQTSPVNHVDVDAPFSIPEHEESPQLPPPSPKAAPEHPVTSSECFNSAHMSQSSPYSTDSDTVPDESSSNSPKSPFIEIIDECDKSPQTPQPSPQTNLPLPMELAPTTLEPVNSPHSVPEYVESPHTPPHPTSPSPTPTPLPIPEEMEQNDNHDILERVDTPPSIPEYVESPPQTPPPPIASPTDVLPESPSPSQHDHIETAESPPKQQSSVPPEQPAPQNEAVNEVGRSLRSKRAKKTKTTEVSKPSPVVTRTSGYFCHLCPLSFEPTARGKYHLARHLAGIHRHENRKHKFACIFCGLSNSTKEHIQRHILYNHDDLLKPTTANNKTEDEDEEEEDLSPPALQRMDEHVQDYGDEDDEDDQLPPPLLTPFNL